MNTIKLETRSAQVNDRFDAKLRDGNIHHFAQATIATPSAHPVTLLITSPMLASRPGMKSCRNSMPPERSVAITSALRSFIAISPKPSPKGAKSSTLEMASAMANSPQKTHANELLVSLWGDGIRVRIAMAASDATTMT